MGILWASWTPLGRVLGASSDPLGPLDGLLRPPGGFSGLLGALLGQSWSPLGPSWGLLGRVLGCCGA
eukprot:5590221-Pyramimonas_sp.AAC.1